MESTINARSRSQTLVQAVKNNDIARVEELLNTGMDVNKLYPIVEPVWTGYKIVYKTLLTIACGINTYIQGDNIDMIKLLINYGADVNKHGPGRFSEPPLIKCLYSRKDIIEFLADRQIKPTSMIDISDGLASEIIHLCKQSNVGCQLYEEKLPIDQQTYQTAMDFNLNPSTCALNGGEDYELLFTIKQKDFEEISKNAKLTIIGHITKKESGYNLIGHGDTSIPITSQGWSHI